MRSSNKKGFPEEVMFELRSKKKVMLTPWTQGPVAVGGGLLGEPGATPGASVCGHGLQARHQATALLTDLVPSS